MITYDEMPDDNAELANIDIQFDYLQDNIPESCPVPINEVLDYLSIEALDGEQANRDELEFLRTARVADHSYWIWRFMDKSGSQCYATVSVSPDGHSIIGFDEDYYQLTPEQFMLGDYHQVF